MFHDYISTYRSPWPEQKMRSSVWAPPPSVGPAIACDFNNKEWDLQCYFTYLTSTESNRKSNSGQLTTDLLLISCNTDCPQLFLSYKHMTLPYAIRSSVCWAQCCLIWQRLIVAFQSQEETALSQCKYLKAFSQRCQELNPRPSACKAVVLPLSYYCPFLGEQAILCILDGTLLVGERICCLHTGFTVLTAILWVRMSTMTVSWRLLCSH